MSKLRAFWRWALAPDPRYAGRRLIDPSFEQRANRDMLQRILRAVNP